MRTAHMTKQRSVRNEELSMPRLGCCIGTATELCGLRSSIALVPDLSILSYLRCNGQSPLPKAVLGVLARSEMHRSGHRGDTVRVDEE
jgi:hypothetical protein